MEKKEMRDRLVQLCVKAYMFGSEQVIIDLPSLIGFVEAEIDKAREEGRMSAMNELKRAFSKVFYKSGELWFDYLFEDGDTEAEEDAKAVVEGYWEDILSELKDKN